jgi:predicted ATPase
MAWTLLLLGSADQALAESQQSLALARKVSHPYALGMALHLSCIFHQLRGDGTMLAERSDELVALATEQGFPHFVGSGTCFRGWATIALGGSISDAIGKIRDGLATKRATGAEIKVPYYLGLLAEANRRIDRTTEGLNLLREALELAERTDERWYEAELYRLRGEVLVAKSDSDGAELWFSVHSRRHRHRTRNCGNSARPAASPTSGATKVSAPKPANSSRRSIAGSPRGSTRRT